MKARAVLFQTTTSCLCGHVCAPVDVWRSEINCQEYIHNFDFRIWRGTQWSGLPNKNLEPRSHYDDFLFLCFLLQACPTPRRGRGGGDISFHPPVGWKETNNGRSSKEGVKPPKNCAQKMHWVLLFNSCLKQLKC